MNALWGNSEVLWFLRDGTKDLGGNPPLHSLSELTDWEWPEKKALWILLLSWWECSHSTNQFYCVVIYYKNRLQFIYSVDQDTVNVMYHTQ